MFGFLTTDFCNLNFEQKMRNKGIIKGNEKKAEQVEPLLILRFRALKKPPKKGGVVPGTGIEPAHPCEYQILSLTRLPIPPSGQTGCENIGTRANGKINVGVQL